MAGRQGREELIKQGLLEMMEQGKWGHRGRTGTSGGARLGYRVWETYQRMGWQSGAFCSQMGGAGPNSASKVGEMP
jgi:hypothetical protein